MENLNFKINFVNVGGYYQPEPVAFMHVWYRCKNVPEVAKILQTAWDRFKLGDTYIPDLNSKGKKTDPKLHASKLQEKAKSFRRKNVYMKQMPRHSTSKYDWEKIVSASMAYKDQQSTFNF